MLTPTIDYKNFATHNIKLIGPRKLGGFIASSLICYKPANLGESVTVFSEGSGFQVLAYGKDPPQKKLMEKYS